ncbi:hypothetical protein [Flavobacterium sp.]|uniref:hypothetical protein n=1 Tax=Flavobacterium sp. TaxID=239 RepID=UPI003752BD64
MKNILILFSTIFMYSFVSKKEIAMVPQVNTVLYADVIFLGKITKVDSLGFYASVNEEVVNETSDKNLFKTKQIFVSHSLYPENVGRYNYTHTPVKNTQFIFTLKQDEKTKKIVAFYYSFGIAVLENQDNKCYVNSSQKQELLEPKKVIEGIKKLKKCVANSQNLWNQEIFKFKVTDTELSIIKESNSATKLWIEEIESRNNYYKKLKN